MDPNLVKQIDRERAKGALPDDIQKRLKRHGVKNPEKTLAEYMQTPLPDGRPRGQVNPGDPRERNGA